MIYCEHCGKAYDLVLAPEGRSHGWDIATVLGRNGRSLLIRRCPACKLFDQVQEQAAWIKDLREWIASHERLPHDAAANREDVYD